MSLVTAAALLMEPATARASRRVFLWFADGGVPPKSVNDICIGRPPAFRCTLGPTVDDCRQAIQVFLDRWYAEADVVFTYAPPADGAFDTVVLSNDGAWCNEDPRTVSRSPLPMCTPVERGAVAIFRCGDDAKACATLIAKEQAHLLGLQHTASATDVMNELGATEHDGFEDRFNGATSARCGALQNSRRLLIERAGAWPGGAKPDPGSPPDPVFPGAPDAAAVDAGTADAGTIDATAPEPDGGDDAATSVDAGGAPRPKSGGCSYATDDETSPAPGALGLGVLAAALIRRSIRRSRAPTS